MRLFKISYQDQPASDTRCDCFDPYDYDPNYPRGTKIKINNTELKVHADTQDRECKAWRELLYLIDEAAKDKREVFEPAKELGLENWKSIETLPREIAKLKNVKHLMLYSSHLTWIPPEIGEMESLERFTPYTSYKLHWFPYEIIKCKNLRDSCVSTRTLYGNIKYRIPFPNLDGNPVQLYKDYATCSVCGTQAPEHGLNQLWISLRVATDVLPLLVHTCSQNCIDSLPVPSENYVQRAHKGGINLVQPETEYEMRLKRRGLNRPES